MKRIILLALMAGGLLAQPRTEYEKGNVAYQKEDYSTAIAAYESALHSGYEAFELYYNLGNACYKMNQIGKSMLYYEKAKRLYPSDPDLLFNLELAQLRVVDKMITPPEFFWNKVWRGIKSLASLDQLAVYTLIFLVLAVILSIGKMFLEKEPWRSFVGYAWSPVLILFVLVGLLFLWRANQASREREGIIMAEKVSVFSSPINNGTEVFALHEGSKVRIQDRSSGFIRIALPDGKVGWVPVNTLAEI
jgi:tetratricopeptide (TPR) repeat protein